MFLRRLTAASRSPLALLLQRALWTAMLPGAVLFVWMQVRGYQALDMVGVDSHAYWLAARDPGSWYTRAPGTRDAYLYSPAFAQLLWPLGHLPWAAFQAVWATVQVAVLAWLLAPLGWRRAVPLGLLLCTDVILGNVYILFAAALVLVRRGSGSAAVAPLLTKLLPAVVGLYHAGRRDWAAVARSGFAVALVAGVSAALSPDAWVAWARFLVDSGGESSALAGTLLRVSVAAALALLAGARGRAWLLVPAMVLACPFLGGYGPAAIAAALPRLISRGRTDSSGRQQEDVSGVVTDDAPAPVAL